MPTEKHTAVGIDGCRDGWIAAIHKPDGSFKWMLEKSVRDILKTLPEESIVLIDMIIGLPDATQPYRECDRLARKILSPHGSRVFPAPPGEALEATSYAEACELARAATGKAISKQCWHLFPKIRELEAVSDPRVRESHPELVFYRLNHGSVVADSKKSQSGRTQRLDLLESAVQGSRETYDRGLKDFLRKDVTRDDLIDALALCAAASQPEKLRPTPASSASPKIWY